MAPPIIMGVGNVVALVKFKVENDFLFPFKKRFSLIFQLSN